MYNYLHIRQTAFYVYKRWYTFINIPGKVPSMYISHLHIRQIALYVYKWWCTIVYIPGKLPSMYISQLHIKPIAFYVYKWQCTIIYVSGELTHGNYAHRSQTRKNYLHTCTFCEDPPKSLFVNNNNCTTLVAT